MYLLLSLQTTGPSFTKAYDLAGGTPRVTMNDEKKDMANVALLFPQNTSPNKLIWNAFIDPGYIPGEPGTVSGAVVVASAFHTISFAMAFLSCFFVALAMRL